MNIAGSVRKAIDDWLDNEVESAMLHACNAVDGTARKLHPELGNKARFTRVLRENYAILGPMGAPGIDLAGTRWPITIQQAETSLDMADIIYRVHRCAHGHGDELPSGFELIPDADGPKRRTRIAWDPGSTVRLSDRIIFGLLAVAVFSPANKDQILPNGYFLTYGDLENLVINEWWGRACDFPAIVAQDPVPQVTLEFQTGRNEENHV